MRVSCKRSADLKPDDIVPGTVIHARLEAGTCQPFLVLERMQEDELQGRMAARIFASIEGADGLTLRVYADSISIFHKGA